MARKKEEVEKKSKAVDTTSEMETVEAATTFEIDDSPIGEEMMQKVELPKKPVQELPKPRHEEKHTGEPVNCLRNERIIVRFVPRPSSMVQNPRHILYGGMAETATRSYVVPRLNSTGMFKNILTDNEKSFLEKAMGLEYNALSIYKKENNFWDDSNPMGIGRVILHKQDNYFDLSVPEDYIKYKILLANKDQIASSLEELEDRPKATYQFVIISESSEAKLNSSKADIKKKCWMEFWVQRQSETILRHFGQNA